MQMVRKRRLRVKLLKWAKYLNELQDNMQRNDADMYMDACIAPEIIAERMRKIVREL